MKDWLHSSSLAWLQLLSGRNLKIKTVMKLRLYFISRLICCHYTRCTSKTWKTSEPSEVEWKWEENVSYFCACVGEKKSLFCIVSLQTWMCLHSKSWQTWVQTVWRQWGGVSRLLWSGLLGWLNLCHMTSAKGHGLKPNHCTHSDSHACEMQHDKVTEKTDFPFEEAAEAHTLWRGGWQTDSHAWATSCMRRPSEKPAVSK